MDDIVDRLLDENFRGAFQHLRSYSELDSMHTEAADAITTLRASLAEAEGVIDRAEIASGLTSDGNLWRYWRGKTAALAIKFTALRAERDAAYRKGAEDMRERAAAEIETRDGAIPDRQEIAAAIRKLEPTP